MNPCKMRPATACLVALLLSVPVPAPAQLVDPIQGGERRYPFTDLPGVATQGEAAARDELSCSRSYDDSERQRWGEFRKPVYTCTQNGRTFTSEFPPISREREMRGLPR